MSATLRLSEARDTLLLGGEQVALETVQFAELEVFPPNVRLAAIAALSGGFAVPALSALAAVQGTTPLMVGALAGAAVLVFAGCYQLVSGSEHYRLTLHLHGGGTVVAATEDGHGAQQILRQLERLGKRKEVPLRLVTAEPPPPQVTG